MTKQDYKVIEYSRQKLILINNHELDVIVVNRVELMEN